MKIRVSVMIGKKSNPKIFNETGKYSLDVVLIEEHYFLDETTEIMMNALKNHDEMKYIENFHKIGKKNNKPISSTRLVQFLIDNKEKHLKQIIEIERKEVEPENIKSLEYNEKDVIEARYTPKENLNTKDHQIAFLHFSTFIDKVTTFDSKQKKKERKQLKEFIACSKVFDGETLEFVRENDYHEIDKCGLKFLQSLTKDTIVYTNSLKCDLTFLVKWLHSVQLDERGTTISGGKGLFTKHKTKTTIKIYFRDMSLLIPINSEDYAKSFLTKEEQDKIKIDHIPQKYFNWKYIDEPRCVKINKVKKYIPAENIKEFEETINQFGLVDERYEDEFDQVFYKQRFGTQEVDVMSKSFFKFREWMLQAGEIDIINYKTLAKYADDVLLKAGCYEGVYKFDGIPEEFIRRALSGGRNMIADNEPSDCIVTKYLQMLDGIALYPSAMTVMNGFLKGKPKVLKTTDYEKIKNYDGYFIEIDITKINKHRSFPLLSRVNEKKGVREYTNGCLGIHVVSKFCLEDLIKFQDIEFKIIRGYYFNEGRNNKIESLMKKFHSERKRYEKEGNKIYLAYKNLMNSSYGYTILKKSDHAIKYFDTLDQANSFIDTNIDQVVYRQPIDGTEKHRVKVKRRIDTSKTLPHVGIEILDRAKRIMNEVICLAEDNKIKVYYTDTDSIHMALNDIDKLGKLYKEEYGRELIGDQLCQFHYDIKPPPHIKDYDKDYTFRAIKTLYCKRKVYIQQIQYMVNGKKKRYYNIKMKGIPMDAIKAKAESRYGGDPIKMYEDILVGKEIEFDLTSGDTIRLSYKKDFTIYVVDEFKRKIKSSIDDA